MIRVSVLCCTFFAIFKVLFARYTEPHYITDRTDTNIYNVSLNGNNSVTLHWRLNYRSDTILFEVHVPNRYGWFAIGFSDRGNFFPADYCFLWKNRKNNEVILQDTFTDENATVHIDKQQNCTRFKYVVINGVLKFTFRRKFDTCDPNDYIIEGGTTHIVWSGGRRKLYKANGVNISSLPEDSGMVRLDLLKSTEAKTKFPFSVKVLDVLTHKVNITPDETTYWCHVYKLPKAFHTKHHIYQYESKIQNTSQGLVHHMEVFHCETGPDVEIPLYAGNCFAEDRPPETQVCKRVLAAWAMGAPPFTYPNVAALPIGGKKFNQYVMLEVHYNNPEHIEGLVDSSGIRFYVSNKLRRFDAGVMELGLEYTDKMIIPPEQQLFSLTGYCTAGCTYVSLPPDGITIFGSQLHTHLAGIRVRTRHIDENGIELPELNRDDHFSTHFQEIRRLKSPVTLLPGQTLITTCDYNTEDRENITLGGFSITEEMCVNYIHYYPLIDLEVCKSSVNTEALNLYFLYLNQYQGQSTSLSKSVSENYEAIEWNIDAINGLINLYNYSPLSMQCNMSTGDRFPGYWDNVMVPHISRQLPPPLRKCKTIEDEQSYFNKSILPSNLDLSHFIT